ncbi:ABC transporter substrate-binding protein [Leucobacter sp. M11]|uniref:ABC transporter substrate-binding protein n=1 Tax=Leucobacter sp. M11 TaxID=2993565 RepID=UPI002D7E2B9F|nr:ABC transporter substrate-binding protein [Leucobacter sp. M11]MEB4616039.1 ABC transporter substrate-binding protein [Leucobacter sp. M11]
MAPIRPRSPLRALAAVAALGALALTAGCAAGPTRDTAAPIVWAIAGTNLESGHMDPHRSQLDSSSYVARLALDSLVFLDEDGELQPWLATDWAVEDGGTRVTFQLREDVTFHDGTPFNAEAVRANFEHITAESTESAQAVNMLGGELYLGTEVTGEFSVAVSFSQPFVPFINNASTAFLGMYSPKTLAENADRLRVGGPGVTVGSGPYVMTDLVAQGQITYERNADYAWAPGGVPLPEAPAPGLELRFVPESSVRVQAVNSGEVDLATGFDPADVAQLDPALEITAVDSPGIPYSLFANTRDGAFAEVEVRRAFREALDIDAAVQATSFGELDRAWAALSPTTPSGYDPELEGSWPQDQDAARARLDAAGWSETAPDGIRVKDGERLSLTWLSWTPGSEEQTSMAALFTESLAEVGIELTHEVVEPAVYNERYPAGDFTLTDWSFAAVDADALRAHLHSAGFQNASQVNDPELDALLERAAAVSDRTERGELYREVLRWNDEQVAIIPVSLPAMIGARSPELRGVATDVYGWPTFAGATFAPAE